MNAASITIRECHSPREFEVCVALQKEVWQFDDVDVIPKRMFVVAAKIGGQVLGAYDNDVMVGFTLAIPGSKDGHSYLHSHMLAVKAAYRNSGTGRRLKFAQREHALASGYELMEWTFDPLEIKNAHLNITKLGAVARRYLPNHYGDSSSPLQGGLPTDRLVAEWWLKSKRVEQLLQQDSYDIPEVLQRIEVPEAIYEWKAEEQTRSKARDLQSRNRESFQQAFSKGLSVVAYARDTHGNGSFLLGKWEP